MTPFEIGIIVLYFLGLLFILGYSLTQLSLAIHYIRYKRKLNSEGVQKEKVLSEFPQVTIQLPIFNEMYVVERLLDAVMLMDYPKEKLEIQVLDDSTDETLELSRKKVEEYVAKGFDIKLVRRFDRKGYKAGALQYGLQTAKGEFVAIFDADFVPKSDFLQRTLPFFERDNVGLVQTKWEHINKEFSILTKVQAFALDAHFNIEQQGRNHADHFIHFNGTAGVWRRTCIDDAGGWAFDMLTEDLELSYRAQMNGWKFKYVGDIHSPAELPAAMNAIKSQQYRWSKGPAEVAKKWMWELLSSDMPFRKKWHSFFHLMNTSINIFVLYTSLLSVPLLIIKIMHPEMWVFDLIFVFLVSLIFIGFFYALAQIHQEGDTRKGLSSFAVLFPSFLSLSMGLSLHNSMAAWSGFRGEKSPFIRTPKHSLVGKDGNWLDKKYQETKIDWMTLSEFVMAFYFLGGIGLAFYFGIYGLLPFHLMLFLGFSAIATFSVKHALVGR